MYERDYVGIYLILADFHLSNRLLFNFTSFSVVYQNSQTGEPFTKIKVHVTLTAFKITNDHMTTYMYMYCCSELDLNYF